MKKILITGGSGFIGSHLVDLLIKKEGKKKLRLFVKKGESLDNITHKNLDIVYGDIRNKKDVAKALKNISIIYHLAAKIDFEGKTYEEYKSVNVDGTINLLNECKNNKIDKFVLYSSIGVYGLPAGIGEIRGWSETHAKTYTNYYGRSKMEAEEVVIKAHQDFNLSYAIIRPASVYGPREKGPTLALYKSIKNKSFFMIGSGENKMHYVYVQDLTEATVKAGNSKLKRGDYIIAGGNPEKFRNIVKYVAKSIDVKPPTFSIPKSVALFISYIFLAVSKLTAVNIPLFPSRVKTMTTAYYYDISKAKRELGWSPKVSLEKGAKLTGKWYTVNGFL